ncbi:hypothetical protein K440DRAFT_682877 [Wilcoxina mikolae CBS 423.85]|nr:hypothetical protein K440DRAFT_682877 [Wilcoxina mikolae CBS 423.85]
MRYDLLSFSWLHTSLCIRIPDIANYVSFAKPSFNYGELEKSTPPNKHRQRRLEGPDRIYWSGSSSMELARTTSLLGNKRASTTTALDEDNNSKPEKKRAPDERPERERAKTSPIVCEISDSSDSEEVVSQNAMSRLPTPPAIISALITNRIGRNILSVPQPHPGGVAVQPTGIPYYVVQFFYRRRRKFPELFNTVENYWLPRSPSNNQNNACKC